MAKPKKAEDGEVKNNIEDIEGLSKEYISRRMPERKLVALRRKLVSLFKEGLITNAEQELMETILKRDRALATILPHDNYLLNKIEYDRLERIAFVKTDDAPTVHHLKKDLECKFFYDHDFNDGKNKKDSVGRYVVYVPRTVPVTHQLSEAVVRKENMGHPIDPKEYPEEKILIHRIVLKDKEFNAWFEVEEDDILKDKNKEIEYTF